MNTKPVLFAAAALPVVFIAGGAFWFSTTPSGADADNPKLVALGSTIYTQQCVSCHGAHLEGQANWKERLPNGRLPAPPHDASGHTWHHPDQQLFDITKNGPSGILPGYESDMPAFKGKLTDREIWTVLAFIKSTWPPDIRARQERINKQGNANTDQ
jgi:mono/diheme cytochrome c family protein